MGSGPCIRDAGWGFEGFEGLRVLRVFEDFEGLRDSGWAVQMGQLGPGGFGRTIMKYLCFGLTWRFMG